MRRVLVALVLLPLIPLAAVACLWDPGHPHRRGQGDARGRRGAHRTVREEPAALLRDAPGARRGRTARASRRPRRPSTTRASPATASGAGMRRSPGWKRSGSNWTSSDPSRPVVKEHLYRYHANHGTFLAHRWSRAGADRSKLVEVEAARDQIARALEINPDAHFGREKYQLQALDWIIAPPALGPQYLPNPLGWEPPRVHGPRGPEAGRRGSARARRAGRAGQRLGERRYLQRAERRAPA